MNYTKKSKFLSLVLRHHPEEIGIQLDAHGWANVPEILDGMGLSMQELEHIVDTDNKQRYSFNMDKTKIRANQGHSVLVDVELEKATPPAILWHGTAQKYVSSIDQMGLISKKRLYVHLSKDIDTAKRVGSRHGKVVVYQVNTKQMCLDGYSFYLSKNGVWLTKRVPAIYLRKETI